MRILGIDYGSRRVGLAVSDALGIVALGLETLAYSGSLEELLREIQEAARRHQVEEYVVGLPLNMNGTKGGKAKEVEAFAESLKQATQLPVHLWDERLTTVLAERELSQFRLGPRKKKRLLDRISAQVILQSYLDSRRSPSAP
ncbi:MAG: Holliday junction resolvase RuvX [Candidatus Omnitrophota bacterium]